MKKAVILAALLLLPCFAFAQGGTGIGTNYTTYRDQTSTPSTPGANYKRLFFESTGIAMVDSTGAKTPINGASLLSTTTVTLAADGEQTIYTVPTGKSCILTMAILVAADNANSTDITIGADGAETDWLGTQQCDNLNAAGDAVILQPVPNATPVLIKSYAAGTVIKFTVANQAGAAGNTLFLFGILY